MITKHSMTVTWSRPTVDGGSEINGYYLEKRDKKSLSWFKVLKETIRDTRQKVTGLTENSEYQFRVSAVNAAGQGPFSEASDFYKAIDPIGKKPTNLYNFQKKRGTPCLYFIELLEG